VRTLISLAAAGLCASVLTQPVDAAQYRHHAVPHFGYSARPYWQGEPTDRLPIWRYGYYQGNDPDQFIRGQLMRDPPNLPGRY
jgi:hypothetical protein